MPLANSSAQLGNATRLRNKSETLIPPPSPYNKCGGVDYCQIVNSWMHYLSPSNCWMSFSLQPISYDCSKGLNQRRKRVSSLLRHPIASADATLYIPAVEIRKANNRVRAECHQVILLWPVGHSPLLQLNQKSRSVGVRATIKAT